MSAMSAGRVVVVLALASAMMASACSSPTEVERLVDELERAEARWHAGRPDRYTAVERRSCECTPEMTGPVELEVRLDLSLAPRARELVVGATYVGSGEPVEEPNLPLFLTAQQLFDLLRRAIDEGWDQVDADFHPELGYPTFVSVDPERQIADDEYGVFFEVTSILD